MSDDEKDNMPSHFLPKYVSSGFKKTQHEKNEYEILKRKQV